jgi:hypothetical protein
MNPHERTTNNKSIIEQEHIKEQDSFLLDFSKRSSTNNDAKSLTQNS